MTYLNESFFFDFQHEHIQKLIHDYKSNELSPKEKAIALYSKIRDDWWYNPYHISINKYSYRASHIATKNSGNCVEKSILLIACLRALNIPARLHLGKVKNHFAVERLMEKFGSNELTPHGMVNVYLNGQWLKMSPAFNKSLCEKMQVDPLDFDGERSSFLQAYNNKGTRFMEYVDDYGFFEDVPLDFMIQLIKSHYPHIFDIDNGETEFYL